MRLTLQCSTLTGSLFFFHRRFVTSALKMTPYSSSLQSTFERLQSNPDEIFVLDGGTGEEIFRRGVPDDRKIWSATALVHEEYHSIIQKVHLSFLQAGSNAITCNSYGVVPGVGFSPQECSKYMDTAGKIAREAVSIHSSGFVFGSLGPLVESYRADMIKPHNEGVDHYIRACQALHQYVDAFLAETMSCVEESLQVIEAAASLSQPKPVLVSYSLDSQGNFRDGQSVLQGINQLLDMKSQHKIELLAVMFNCAEPEAITLAFSRIQEDPNLSQRLRDSKVLLGAYANRLTAVDPGWTLADSKAPQPFREDLGVQHYWEDFVKKWVDQFGVQLVGGCCGITPEHIAHICAEVQKREKHNA